MTKFSIIHRLCPAAAVLGISLLLSGCIYDSLDGCMPEEGVEVTMTFRIATQNTPGTKADIIGTEVGSVAENWIDPETVKFLLFSSGGSFLQDITAVADSQRKLEPDNDVFSRYIVSATFKEPYFVSGAVDGNVKFRIMVLANWPSAALDAVGKCNSVAEIEAVHASCVIADNFRPAYDVTTDTGVGIPMYGIKEFTVSQQSLINSTEQAPVDLYNPLADDIKDNINMLRCLARIEVIDNISGKNEEGYPKIRSVNQLNWNDSARLIPAGFENGVQVTAPSYPDSKILKSGDKELVSEDGNVTFMAYAPEMSMSELNNGSKAFEIIVENSADEVSPYIVTIPADNNKWGAYLLRNHIYRLSVNSVASTMSLTYTVCPWDIATVTIPSYPETNN